jgi:hypothetical protein
MQPSIIWSAGGNTPENPAHLDEIRHWWQQLRDRKIFWQQRILPADAHPQELDWQPQRFDEVFAIQNPDLRGITLYWQKPDASQERNITPSRLELDRPASCLYVYPQSQSQVVLRIGLPQVRYESIELSSVELSYVADSDPPMLIIRDPQQRVEVKVKLDGDRLAQLKQQLSL